MKVYTKILLWCLRHAGAFAGGVHRRLHLCVDAQFSARQFRAALQCAADGGGHRGLADRRPTRARRPHCERVARQIPGGHYLTDPAGKDLATGEDRSRLLAMARPDTGPPKRFANRQVVMYPSPDDKYRFLVVYENFFDLSQYLPYYLLILAAVALLCWILATNLASPLRGLARVVDRFGAGDLSVRVNSSRKDEIGEVGRAFDRMAERIGTLLTAERRLLQDISTNFARRWPASVSPPNSPAPPTIAMPPSRA